MSVLVLIVKYWTKPGNTNISRLLNSFSDPYFVTEVFDRKVPESTSSPTTYLVLKALEYAREHFPLLPVCIIMDNSVVNDCDMKARTIELLATGTDLGYYGKWMDTCSQYDWIGYRLVNTFAPKGVQSVLYSPNTRDILINFLLTSSVSDIVGLISTNKLSASAFTPNVIDFDIELATDNSQLLYINECSAESSSNTDNTASSIVFFVIAVGVVAMFAWSLLSIGKDK